MSGKIIRTCDACSSRAYHSEFSFVIGKQNDPASGRTEHVFAYADLCQKCSTEFLKELNKVYEMKRFVMKSYNFKVEKLFKIDPLSKKGY